jgi:hypothetical protein
MFSNLSHRENANQNFTKIPFHPIQIGNHQENTQQILGKVQGEKEPHWWECKLMQCLWK